MIPLDKAKIRSSAKTHPGLSGKANQDRFALQAFQLKESSPTESVLAILADGVGGQRAGETAAQLTVDVLYDSIASSQGSQPNGILQSAILRAEQAILTQSEGEKAKWGMGSTALCAWVIDQRLFSASVGDSRLYLLRGERLHLVNVPREVKRPRGSKKDQPEEEQSSAGYLGSRMREDIEMSLAMDMPRWLRGRSKNGIQLSPNDRLLLCTDGLIEALDEQRIAEILGQSRIEDAASNLVQAALEAGAQTNLTALAIAIPPGRPMRAYQQVVLQRRLRLILAALLLIFISLIGWYFLAPQITPGFTPLPTAINTLTPIP